MISPKEVRSKQVVLYQQDHTVSKTILSNNRRENNYAKFISQSSQRIGDIQIVNFCEIADALHWYLLHNICVAVTFCPQYHGHTGTYYTFVSCDIVPPTSRAHWYILHNCVLWRFARNITDTLVHFTQHLCPVIFCPQFHGHTGNILHNFCVLWHFARNITGTQAARRNHTISTGKMCCGFMNLDSWLSVIRSKIPDQHTRLFWSPSNYHSTALICWESVAIFV